MKDGILTATSCFYFLCRVKMSETNQQQDELPAYLKDEPPTGTGSYADILISDFTVIPSCNNQAFFILAQYC